MELNSFWGLRNLYQRFVANFARLPGPLNDKPENGEPKQFHDQLTEEMGAFAAMQQNYKSALVLALPGTEDYSMQDTLTR